MEWLASNGRGMIDGMISFLTFRQFPWTVKTRIGRTIFTVAICLLAIVSSASQAAEPERPPPVVDVDLQPFAAQARRVVQALDLVGAPLDKTQRESLERAYSATDATDGVRQIQAVFDPLCLATVEINAESRVKVVAGPAAKKLIQQGWRAFLVEVRNDAGIHSLLRVSSPNALRMQVPSSGSPEPKSQIQAGQLRDRWLDIDFFDRPPLSSSLSGLRLEFRVIELYSRDAGSRDAKIEFDAGQGTQDLGFRSEINVLFDCQPAVDVKLTVLDDDGSPTTASFVIRDGRGRVYPAPARRLAPDFFFQNQIYRHDGESVALPPGTYHVTYTRGPEYQILSRDITVPSAAADRETFKLRRWIKLVDDGWYSGDHHIHAAGCSHYESPSAGVGPSDMMRHIAGEDLNVGCVLAWGPCWYHQKHFFEGQVSKLSLPSNLMRYDVEVSGFPSSHAGHLCLLRLKEDDYPGTTRIEEWPSWDLPILRWAKSQGAVVGFAHSGWGLKTAAKTLPAYEMPPFDGIGANEYIVDVAHDAVDFISSVDTPILWELPIWYHTLNCGFTTRLSGETDFPCIYGDRVGLGRSYVKIPAGQPLDYDAWVHGLRDGRAYTTDGRSHLFDLAVNGLGVGEIGAAGRPSVLAAKGGDKLSIKVRAAALLEEKPRDDIRRLPLEQKPSWHLERARIGDTRQVPVELIVNGRAVDRRVIEADGRINNLTFDYAPAISSWIALRIFPSSHTNPVFVELDGKPIRASRRSAQWCLDAVDVCWRAKRDQIRPSERPAAEAAYNKAREVYRARLAESIDDRSQVH